MKHAQAFLHSWYTIIFYHLNCNFHCQNVTFQTQRRLYLLLRDKKLKELLPSLNGLQIRRENQAQGRTGTRDLLKKKKKNTSSALQRDHRTALYSNQILDVSFRAQYTWLASIFSLKQSYISSC